MLDDEMMIAIYLVPFKMSFYSLISSLAWKYFMFQLNYSLGVKKKKKKITLVDIS